MVKESQQVNVSHVSLRSNIRKETKHETHRIEIESSQNFLI